MSAYRIQGAPKAGMLVSGLTARETRILAALLDAAGARVEGAALEAALKCKDDADAGAVLKVTMHRLRAKLAPLGMVIDTISMAGGVRKPNDAGRAR